MPKNEPDLASQHVTPADGNVFLDLGFTPEEAKRLLDDADRVIFNLTPEQFAQFTAALDAPLSDDLRLKRLLSKRGL